MFPLPYIRRAHGHIAQKILSYSHTAQIEGDDLNWIAASPDVDISYVLIQSDPEIWVDKASRLGTTEIWMLSDSSEDLLSSWTRLPNMNTMSFDIKQNISKLSPDPRVRMAVPGDVKEINRVHADGFDMKSKNTLSPWATVAAINDPNISVFVVEIDGVLAATATTVIHDDVVHFWAVSVAKTHQRQGLGKALISSALVDASNKGISKAFLCSTSVGEHLYKSLGWEMVESWPTWYRSVEDPVKSS